MLLDRITKETTDHTRFVYDFEAEGLLDPGETLTLSSAVINLGETGWSEAPFPAPGAPPPYDPTPLLFQTAVLDVTRTKLVVFTEFGTPGNVYTCVFIVNGTSGRQITCELAVQITGEPPEQPLPVPVDGGSKPALGLSIYGGTMQGPLYLYENPLYPTEAATKYYVDNVMGATGGPFLQLAGGTMAGPLVLAGDPVNPMDAATRQYVDLVTGLIGGPYLPLTGGTLTGDLHFNGAGYLVSLYTGDPAFVFHIVADRHELDLVGRGVWVYSPDETDGTSNPDSSGAGVGTGNVTAGSGASGICWIYSGNVISGTSGMVNIQSGQTDLDPATETTLHGATGDTVVGTGNAVNADSGALNFFTGNTDNPDGVPGRSSGVVDITTGIASGTGNKSGDILIHPGAVIGGATPGAIILDAATINFPNPEPVFTFGDASGGDTYFTTGFTGNNSGQFGIQTNDVTAATGNSGGAYIGTGQAGTSGGNSGNISLYTQDAPGGTAGDILLSCGSGSDLAHSGHILLATGKNVTVNLLGGADLIILNPKTADPHVVGAVWVDTSAGRVLKVSAG